MSPDTPEGQARRINALEQTVARNVQRLDDLAEDLRNLTQNVGPLIKSVAEVQSDLRHMDSDLRELRKVSEQLAASMRDGERARQEAREEDRRRRDQEDRERGSRRWQFTIGAALVVLSAFGSFVLQLLHGAH